MGLAKRRVWPPMSKKDVERKLRVEIAPYLVTAEYLWQWPPYLIYVVYSYLGEIFVLLTGFGIAKPMMS